MSMTTDPKWHSGDPQGWSTYWRATYQIGTAPPVVVAEYERVEKRAFALAEEALKGALTEIAGHGIEVEGRCWTTKHQSRSQSRNFAPSSEKTYRTGDWYGRFTVISGRAEENTPEPTR